MKRFGILLLIATLGLLVMTCSKSYETYMEQAAGYESSGEYEKAVSAFSKAVDKAEDDLSRVAANEGAGRVLLYQLSDLDSAAQYFSAALEYAPALDGEALIALSKQALEADAGKAAVRGYTNWLERFGDDERAPQMHYEMAEVYHKNIRDLRMAVTVYEQVVKKYPESEQAPKSLFSIGYIFANELDDEELARAYYKRFLDNYPDHEMVPSVEFELKYLGKALEEIPELKHLLGNPS